MVVYTYIYIKKISSKWIGRSLKKLFILKLINFLNMLNIFLDVLSN